MKFHFQEHFRHALKTNYTLNQKIVVIEMFS